MGQYMVSTVVHEGQLRVGFSLATYGETNPRNANDNLVSIPTAKAMGAAAGI